MEATAKYSYVATADDELSFRNGDCLTVLQTTGNWYKAELNRTQGFVPKNFININFPSWYQEDVSRSDAKEKLMSQPMGSFLIRRSRDEEPGNFSLSVRNATDVQHLKVLRDSRGRYHIWAETFPSLNQLVEYYNKNSVSKQTIVFLKDTQQQQQRGRAEHFPSLPPISTHPSAKGPPTPPPRPVIALYSFQAKEKDELDFHAGDIITVVDSSDEVWWKGHLRGKTGLFPSNYTKPI